MHDTMNDDPTLDLTLGRILDRRAAPSDWETFATLAQARPDAWTALLGALRAEQGLVHGIEQELAVAERIELPVAAASAQPATGAESAGNAVSAGTAPRATVTRLPVGGSRRWHGWAAAAVLALAWAGSSWLPAAPSPAQTPSGIAAAPESEDARADRLGAPGSDAPGPGALGTDALGADAPRTDAPRTPAQGGPLLASGATDGPRLRDGATADPAAGALPDGQPDLGQLRGDVVGELPLRLVSTSAAADGNGLDVVYLRPVLERTRVAGLYSLGADDLGNPAPVSINPASYLLADNN
jgi:hypothetical protein